MTGRPNRQEHDTNSLGAGLAFDGRALVLGPEVIAWREDKWDGNGCYRIKPAADIARTLRLAYREASDEVIVRRARSLQRVVDLLKDGDEARAGVQVVLARLPEISSEGMAKLAVSRDLRRASDAYLTEDRVAAGEAGAGEWTSGGGTEAGSASLVQIADRVDPTQAKKAKFVKAYLGYAQVAAAKLHVPVENILGMSALESNWGDSRIAKDGKNLFGMYWPALYARRPIPAKLAPGPGKKPVLLAGYDSIQDSFRSFSDTYAAILQNKRDPTEFAAALQMRGKFGRDTYTGAPVKDYIPDVASTINRLRPFLPNTKG